MAIKTVDTELEQFRRDLMADVLEHAESEGQENFIDQAFADLVLGDLEELGEWPDFQLSHHKRVGQHVSAWGLDHLRRILFLAVVDMDRSSSSLTISRSDVGKLERRLASFAESAAAGKVEVEDHNPVADLVDVLREGSSFDELRLHVITDRVLSERKTRKTTPTSARLWDLDAIRRIRTSGERLDPIDVEVDGLPSLDGGGSAGVGTHLLFIPATVLADWYQQFGARLLERNVRAFLSARGKVNRGLRETLNTEPERFLAYNNGLTATAADVERDADGRIIRIHDLQIVNGGQTTASIAAASLDPEIDIDGVSVQMKLVIVDENLIEELVPNISRFANSQNAVQEADLHANHPFLRSLQEVSRTEYTPPSATGRPTKWYFERARGAFGVDQARARTASERRRFDSDYPRSQRFGKNELALYENTSAQLPHLVCRGGQKNFAEYMLRLPEVPEGDEEVRDQWFRATFRDLVAKAILFKTTDKIVRQNLGGTYKRAVVAYTLSFIYMSNPGLDLDEVWQTQVASERFNEAVELVAPPMKELLIKSSNGRNITEWAKQEACWEVLKDLPVPVPPLGASTRPKKAQGVVSSRSRRAPSGGLQRLSEAIADVHGEAVEGKYRRYRRRTWEYVGDSGVPASGSGTLTVFEGQFKNDQGPYVFTVTCDFERRQIIPLEQLPDKQQEAVSTWLERR